MKFHGYPSMYYSRSGASDRKFVMSRMKVIPEHLKMQVSEQYEAFGPVLGGESRKAANVWLNDEALKYKLTPNGKDDVRERVEIEYKASRKPVKEFKKPIDTNTRAVKKTFLNGLLDDVDKKYGKGGGNQ